jgi:hypothetical protein
LRETVVGAPLPSGRLRETVVGAPPASLRRERRLRASPRASLRTRRAAIAAPRRAARSRVDPRGASPQVFGHPGVTLHALGRAVRLIAWHTR